MLLARRLSCAALFAGLAAFVVLPAQAANSPSGLTKDCHVVSFKDVSGVIGPLKSKIAGHTTASETGGILWTCGADSQNFGVAFNAFCGMHSGFGKALFKLYSNRHKAGLLAWKSVSGLGDEAVYVSISHDVETHSPSASFVVRKANNVFIINGHQGRHPMPMSKLLTLTRKALSNNCS